MTDIEKQTDEEIDLTYKSCERFESSGKRVVNFCRAIQNHVKKNKDYYKNYVNVLLENHKSKLPQQEKEKYIPLLNMISKNKPEMKGRVDDFIQDMDNISYLVDENGNWYPLNKLNTNYSDLSEMLSFMIVKFFRNNSTDIFFNRLLDRDLAYEHLKTYKGDNTFVLSLKKQYDGNSHLTLDQLISLSSNFDILRHDFFIKQGLEKVFDKKIKLTIDEIKNFTNNIVKNSHEGKLIEDLIENVLTDNGWNIIHRGGDGDFIDMKFGVDMFIEKNGVYQFVQVKKVWDIQLNEVNSPSSFTISGNITDIREDIIDLLAFGTSDGKYIVIDKQNGGYFPTFKDGVCLVNQSFEGFVGL